MNVYKEQIEALSLSGLMSVTFFSDSTNSGENMYSMMKPNMGPGGMPGVSIMWLKH